jgi:hypothetical protein
MPLIDHPISQPSLNTPRNLTASIAAEVTKLQLRPL